MHTCKRSAVLLQMCDILFADICVISLLNYTLCLTGLQMIHIVTAAIFQRTTQMSTEQTVH